MSKVLEFLINLPHEKIIQYCYSHPNGLEYVCRVCSAIKHDKSHIEKHVRAHTLDEIFTIGMNCDD